VRKQDHIKSSFIKKKLVTTNYLYKMRKIPLVMDATMRLKPSKHVRSKPLLKATEGKPSTHGKWAKVKRGTMDDRIYNGKPVTV
jgi:hypothetical protein